MKHLSVILLTLFLLMGCSAKPAVVDLGGKPVTYPTVEVMEFDSDLKDPVHRQPDRTACG